jgi:hypothetical protein
MTLPMRLLLALSLFATAAGAQASTLPAGVAVGSRLRVETPARRRPVYGTLVALVGDTLILQTTDATPPGEPLDVIDQIPVRLGAATRLSVRSGRESRLRSAARGGAYGAVLGAALAGLTILSSDIYDRHRGRKELPAIPGDIDLPPEFDRANSDHPGRRLAVSVGTMMVPAGVVFGLFRPRWHWRDVEAR